MLDKKEKYVMKYLCKICLNKRTYLVSASSIAEHVCSYCVLTISELDDILISLSKDNYLDFVVSDSKKGYYYCINLKNKGLTYLRDVKKEKHEILMTIFKTILLAGVSFLIGLILKIIFKK